MLEKHDRVLVTRTTPQHNKALLALTERGFSVQIDEIAHCAIVTHKNASPPITAAKIAVFAAGTSDRQVAAEAQVAAEFMGCQVLSYIDVGIAGLHRLLTPLKEVLAQKVAAIVACAGMEGALPAIIASLVPIPVIAVPTSIGYGSSKGGYAALLTMLSSCSPGMAVVNIDAGFNGGAMAALIALNQLERSRPNYESNSC
mgnify:CR=1 FL=1